MDLPKISLKGANRAIRRASEFISHNWWVEPASQRAERLLRKGRACHREKFHEKAIENIKLAIESQGIQRELECEAYFLLGSSYFHLDEISSALNALEMSCRAIRENTEWNLKFDVYLTRGLCFQKQRMLQNASEELKLASEVALAENDLVRLVDALITKAKVDLENNDLERAAEAVDILLSKDTDHIEAKLLQMDIYLQLGRYSELERLFELVFEEQKGQCEFSKVQLGKIFAIKGTAEFRSHKFDMSVESFSKSLEYDSTLKEAKRLRGIAFFKLDKFRNGLLDLIEGVEVADWLPSDLKELNSNIDEKVQMLEKVKIPEEFFCPITTCVMKDPVVAHDGFSYERKAIERWFASHNTSPMTNTELSDKTLRPNIVLRNSIGDLRELMPSCFREEEELDEDEEPAAQ